ncbi:MAG: hypothetical protein H7Z43_01015 [Clostridia bacterium]|nr:hypothetical protein [Deltaproteobacteria bacterium]
MKVLSVGCLVALSVSGQVACDKPADSTLPAAIDSTSAGDVAPQPAKPAGDAAPAEAVKVEQTPVQACTTLIAAATAKDDATFLVNATEATAQAVSDPATKDMVYGLLGANAACGEAAVDGDKATVAVTSGGEMRDIPFVRIGDTWKFDSAEYMNKYPPQPIKTLKGKKAKGAKSKSKA